MNPRSRLVIICLVILLSFSLPVTARDLTWTQATEHAAFSPRGFFSVAEFNNKIWVIGGLNQNGSEKFYNDVWVSSDGVTWDLATGSAGFTPRYGHTTVVHDGKIWVIGGYDIGHNFKNDVWFSEDGKNWKQATPRAAFRPRLLHTSFIYHDKMWVIGGEVTEHPWVYTNDVWYSSDGIAWHQATPSAAFSPRIGHTSVVSNGRMWVTGGAGDAYGKIRYNDSWYSTDGVTWDAMNAPAEFSQRYDMAAAATDEFQWITGGFDGSTSLDDVWVSPGDKTWDVAQSDDRFPPRYGHKSLIIKNQLWVLGGLNFQGEYFNDVWHSSAIESPSPSSKLTVNKSVSPWSIKQGTDTRVTIMYTNDGNTPLHDIEIEDTYPDGFVLISGEPVMAVPQSLMPDESRVLVYTLRATKPGSFSFPRTTVLYAGDDGNYHKTVSKSPDVTVLAPLVAGVETSHEPESFFDRMWQEMSAIFSM